MATLVTDPWVEQDLKERRKARGADHHDEVWEGVHFMPPAPNIEHQKLVMGLSSVLHATIDMAGLGETFPGVNLAASESQWEHDYRVPDVAVFLRGGAAENRDVYWLGAADFVVEITSLGDRTYEKIPFYSQLGVRELLIFDRQSSSLGLYSRRGRDLEEVGQSTPESRATLNSAVVPLRFRLLPGERRPQIEVTHTESGQQWVL